MNILERLLAVACLCTCAAPAWPQNLVVIPPPMPGPTPVPVLSNCSAHPEARATGCSITSEFLVTPTTWAPLGSTCSVLNLHLTKSIHAVLVIGNPGRPPSAGPQGFALAPGAAALFEDPYPAHGGVRCQIYLVVTGPGDHADERQVRAI